MVSVNSHGNTSAASIPLALDKAASLRQNQERRHSAVASKALAADLLGPAFC